MLRNDRNHRLAASIKPDASSMMRSFKRRILLRRKPLTCNDERAQALARHIPRLLFQPVIPLHDTSHNDIRALLQEKNLTAVCVSHDDAHALGLTCEGKYVEDVVGETCVGGRLELHACAVAEDKLEADALCPLDDCDFVWGGGLVGQGAIVVGDWSDLGSEG